MAVGEREREIRNDNDSIYACLISLRYLFINKTDVNGIKR